MTITVHNRPARSIRLASSVRAKRSSSTIEVLPAAIRLRLEDLWAGRNHAMRLVTRLAA